MNTFLAFPEKLASKFWIHFVANIAKMVIEIIRRNITSNKRVFIFTRYHRFISDHIFLGGGGGGGHSCK